MPAPFGAGNIVVYRIGDGSTGLVNTGSPVFLDEYTPAGSLVQTINLPTTTSGSQKALIASGTAPSEGFLTLSSDGRYLLLTGYAAGSSSNLAGTPSSSISRVVGRVDAFGNVDTSTALTDFASTSNPRSVASTNGTDIWVGGGAGGLRYTTFGSTTSTQLATDLTNIRQVGIFNGQLYVSDSSGTNTFKGVATVGTGLSVSSGQTTTRLTGLTDTNSPSAYGFFLADLDSSVVGVDTLYVADDSSDVITKYSFVSGSWTANGTVGASGDDYRGLTGVVNGTSVTLYATRQGGSTAGGGGELVSITDTNGYNKNYSSTTFTTLASVSSTSNMAFRGVAFVPTGIGVIGDRVFIDANADGVFNGSDTGVDGVKVNLYADTNSNGSFDSGGTDKKIATVTTAGGGKYQFSGLLDGKYFVEADISGVSSLAGYGLAGGAQPRLVTIQATPSGTATQFDFNKGNLSASFGLGKLSFFNASTTSNTQFGSTTSFGIGNINGVEANVMKVPGTSNAKEGYRLLEGAPANGGSNSFINKYTFVADVYVPDINKWTPLFNTNKDNANDADAFIRPSSSGGGVGIGSYAGTINANTWYRITVTVDSSAGVLKLRRFINGSEVGTGITLDSLDGRWAAFLDQSGGADAGIILFGDDNTEVNAFYVSSVFFDDRVLSDTEISNLGSPDARGIVAQNDFTRDFAYVNNAPTLSGSNDFTAINEDSTTNSGTLVSALISGKVSDDAGALAGIALTATKTSNGSWEYTTDGGSNWNSVGSVSNTSALLLKSDSNTKLRFVPNADFNGIISSAITFRAWDQTTGTAGNKVDVSTNGGNTAFSSATASANITVNPVADQPSVTSATTNEDNQTTSGLVVTRNSADSTEVTHFKITNIQHGTLFQNNGTTQINTGDFITFAQANAGLKFTPTADYFGNASFDVQGATSSSGAGLGVAATASITVNAVADTPSVSSATTNEDTQSTSGLVVSRNSADNTEVTHFKITNIQHGTLFQNDGTTAISAGSFITFAQANAGLKFTPATDYFGAASFDVQASLSNTNAGLGGNVVTASITVNAVADTPSVTSATTNEDTQSTSGLVVSRNSADNTEVTHFKITNIQHGTLFQNDGTTAISAGSFITSAQANAGLKFTPATDYFGAASFDLQASVSNADAGLGGNVVTANITVNAIADQPSVTSASTNEDTQTSNGLVVSRNSADSTEVTHFKITNIQHGTLFQNDGSTQISSGSFITFAQANAGLKFTPTADYFGNASFDIAGATDSSGGGLSSAVTATIAVSAVADTPSITSATTDEDVQTTSGLVVSRNSADSTEVTHFKITNILHGTLFQNDGNTQINAGDFITFTQANTGLKFTPASNYSGAASFDIQAAVSNSDSGLGGSIVTANITVNAVADTPNVTSATTNEDMQTTSGLVVSRNSADSTEVTHFKVTNIQHGTLFQNDGSTPINNGDFITFAQANAGLRFTPATDYFGSASFDVQASTSNTDAGLGGSAATANIMVNAVADTPGITSAATNEDTQTTSGLVVSRNANDSTEVTHFKITNIQHGTLFQNDGSTPINSGDFITFAQASAGLKFTPTGDYFGGASFDVQASLSNSDSGLGGNVVTANITVNAVADTPSITGANTTVNTQTTSGLVVSRNTADSTEVTHFKVTNIQHGTLFQNNGTTVINNGDFITFAQASAGLKFTPATNYSGTATFDIQASVSNADGGLGGNVVTANVSVSALLTPSVTNATTNEDTLSSSGLVITRNAADGGATQYYKITGITAGTLFQNDGTTTISSGSFITVAEGSAGLKFKPNANLNANTTGFFGFTVQSSTSASDTGLLGSTVTATVTVNAVNDAPSFTASGPPAVNEDSGANAVNGFAAFNPGGGSDEATQTVVAYTVSNVSNPSLFSTLPFVNAAGKLTYTLAANAFGTSTFDLKVQDSGGTGNTGIDTSGTQSFTITVNAGADTPSITNATTDEEIQTTSGLVVSRSAVDGNEVTHFKITNIQHGTLFQNDGTTPINAGDFITFAQASAGLKFTPATDYSGTATFDVQASTSGTNAGLGGSVVTANITVNAVADTPSVTSATTSEDTQTTSGLVVSRNAADGPEVTHFKITGITNGTLYQNDGTTQILSGDFITFAQGSAGLKFTPTANLNSSSSAFSFQVQASTSNMNAGLGGNATTATITVNAVADTPSVTNASTAANTQTTSGLVITRNAFDGSEVGFFKITNIQNGTLFQNNGTTPILSGDFITAAQGTAGLKFTPTAGFTGTGSFDVQASVSNSNSGLGGNTVTASITVNAAAVVSAPPAPPQPVPAASGTQYIAIGTDAGTPARVRLLSPTTGAVLAEFTPFGGYTGGVHVAVADINGDGVNDILVTTAGRMGLLMAYDGRTGAASGTIAPFGAFPSGLQIATGDFDGDGRTDLVLGTETGGSKVMVVSVATGAVLGPVDVFPGFTGGVRLAAGDVNGDGRTDLAIGTGPRGNGFVEVFNFATGGFITSFTSYPGYAGEVNLAVGDLTGDGRAEVIAVATVGGATTVQAFDSQAQIVKNFFAPTSIGVTMGFERTDAVAVVANQAARVAAADVTGDRIADILLGDPPGTGSSKLLILNGATGAIIQNPFAFDPLFGFGVYVEVK